MSDINPLELERIRIELEKHAATRARDPSTVDAMVLATKAVRLSLDLAAVDGDPSRLQEDQRRFFEASPHLVPAFMVFGRQDWTGDAGRQLFDRLTETLREDSPLPAFLN